MKQTSFSFQALRRTGRFWSALVFGLLVLLLGLALLGGGLWLLALGGSGYYALAGIALVGAAGGVFAGAAWGLWLYLASCLLTWA